MHMFRKVLINPMMPNLILLKSWTIKSSWTILFMNYSNCCYQFQMLQTVRRYQSLPTEGELQILILLKNSHTIGFSSLFSLPLLTFSLYFNMPTQPSFLSNWPWRFLDDSISLHAAYIHLTQPVNPYKLKNYLQTSCTGKLKAPAKS